MSDVRHHHDGQQHQLALIGPLTIAEAAETRQALLATLDAAERQGDVAVDLSGITDFDTAGAQLLVATSRWLRQRGQIPQLSAASPSVLAVAQALGASAPDLVCGFGRTLTPGGVQ
jgi:anti-sigma B factor antagonist